MAYILILCSTLAIGEASAKSSNLGEYLTEWGVGGTNTGEFDNPSGIAITPNGMVLIVDTNNDRIQSFGAEGEFVNAVGVTGTAGQQFQAPRGIALDTEGNAYVTDSGNSRVQKFATLETFALMWGTPGAGPGEFNAPFGIAYGREDIVYVADSGNDRIQAFSPDGVYLFEWGGTGDVPGQFDSPTGLATDNLGFVYVADRLNHRIQKFTSGGLFVAQWGAFGTGASEFTNPSGLGWGASGSIYVADTGNNRIQEFSTTGVFRGAWGTTGSGFGEFISPVGVAVDRFGAVYVVDRGNQRVQKFTRLTGSLTGRVRAAASNAGLSTAVVVAIAPDGITQVRATNLGGGFSFNDLPTGTYEVEVFAPEYLRQTATVNVSGNTDQVHTFTLTPRPTAPDVRGLVRDSVTNLILAGVRVDVLSAPGMTDVASLTYTGGAGSFDFAGNDDGTTAVTLRFVGEGYETAERTVDLPVTKTEEIEQTMDPKTTLPGSLVGVVTDAETSDPIENARVTASYGTTAPVTYTTGDGAYIFPSLEPGTYSVEVSADGYDSDSDTTFVYSGDPPAELDFELEATGEETEPGGCGTVTPPKMPDGPLTRNGTPILLILAVVALFLSQRLTHKALPA